MRHVVLVGTLGLFLAACGGDETVAITPTDGGSDTTTGNDGFRNLRCARKLTSGRPSRAAPLADPDLL